MVLDKDSNLFVLLDFYDGAYGPTLRIDIPSRELLEALKSVFQSLAQNKTTRVQLTEADFVRAGNVAGLELLVWEQPKKPPRSKTLTCEQGRQFVWMNCVDGWQHCIDLLEGFGEQPGHQYLTAEGIDDALVEAAYLEC